MLSFGIERACEQIINPIPSIMFTLFIANVSECSMKP